MATFLRFTNDISADMKKGFSYLKTPTMKKAVKLSGLCAFNFGYELEYENPTREEIYEQIERLRMCVPYIDSSTTAVLLEGQYLGQNPNGDGVIIKANRVIREL